MRDLKQQLNFIGALLLEEKNRYEERQKGLLALKQNDPKRGELSHVNQILEDLGDLSFVFSPYAGHPDIIDSLKDLDIDYLKIVVHPEYGSKISQLQNVKLSEAYNELLKQVEKQIQEGNLIIEILSPRIRVPERLENVPLRSTSGPSAGIPVVDLKEQPAQISISVSQQAQPGVNQNSGQNPKSQPPSLSELGKALRNVRAIDAKFKDAAFKVSGERASIKMDFHTAQQARLFKEKFSQFGFEVGIDNQSIYIFRTGEIAAVTQIIKALTQINPQAKPLGDYTIQRMKDYREHKGCCLFNSGFSKSIKVQASLSSFFNLTVGTEMPKDKVIHDALDQRDLGRANAKARKDVAKASLPQSAPSPRNAW